MNYYNDFEMKKLQHAVARNSFKGNAL